MPEPYSYRADPAVPPFPDDRPVIVFDGHCVLCSRFAQFVMRHDPDRRFRLLAVQTPLGTALYRHYGLPVDFYETNLLLQDGKASMKSDCGIRILTQLGLPWSLARLGWVIPRPLRDWLYALVARNRLDWFGQTETCFMPTPSEADRFLG